MAHHLHLVLLDEMIHHSGMKEQKTINNIVNMHKNRQGNLAVFHMYVKVEKSLKKLLTIQVLNVNIQKLSETAQQNI